MSALLPASEFELRGGARLRLYANRVVHEGPGTLEIVPFALLASVRVAFERDARKLNWAIVLLLAALALWAVAGPMQNGFTSLAAREGLEPVLLTVFKAIGAFARMLPAFAAVLGAVALALIALFVLGRTTLTLSFAATERAFGLLGRNRGLIEFAEVLGERLAERMK